MLELILDVIVMLDCGSHFRRACGLAQIRDDNVLLDIHVLAGRLVQDQRAGMRQIDPGVFALFALIPQLNGARQGVDSFSIAAEIDEGITEAGVVENRSPILCAGIDEQPEYLHDTTQRLDRAPVPTCRASGARRDEFDSALCGLLRFAGQTATARRRSQGATLGAQREA